MSGVQGVYPWSDMAWDMARAAGVDPDAVMSELDHLTEDDWAREAVLLEQLNTGLATKLWQDLLNGAVTARDALGKPLPHLPQENAYTGPNKPFVWVEDINGWLVKQGRIDRWEPAGLASNSATVQPLSNGGVFVHRNTGRTNALSAVIGKAVSDAVDPNDWYSVWNELAAMAIRQEPPLIGVADEEIKYTASGEVKFLTKEAFRQRIRRRQ